jgi:hypothetical protein
MRIWRFIGPGGGIRQLHQSVMAGGFLLQKKSPTMGLYKREEPATASKAGSSCGVWSYIFWINVCFWLLHNIYVQKLLL